MPNLNRRTFLAASATTVGAAALGGTGRAEAAVVDPTSRAVYTTGTTLKQVATPIGTSGYRRLTAGPGYPLVVREELVAGKAGRDDRRTAKASIVQFTDLHQIDAQSPVRFEYLHQISGSAFRPQEALGTQGAAQLVQRVNELAKGPFSGRTFDCVVSTGDNTDNHEWVELNWFLTVMNGGSITPNTGSATRWEGVQNSGDALYYNPEDPIQDMYKKAGFPLVPGYFKRAMATHNSVGLKTKWYSVFGNHDNSIEGTLPSGLDLFGLGYIGALKFNGFNESGANEALKAIFAGDLTKLGQMIGTPRAGLLVTPDLRRAPFSPAEYVAAHRAPSATGPGPVGHGFTIDNVMRNTAYYSWQIAPGVTGIAMDSTNRGGFTDGSVGDTQFKWLTGLLTAGSSTYYDTTGAKVRHSATDQLFVIFSHHTSTTMGNTIPAPDNPFEKRHTGPEMVALFNRFPNVLAWVNGHTHVNEISARPGPTAAQGFWEINTASHIDFPQHARIIDVCDNVDGTLSLFTTLIESAAPYQAAYTDGSQAGLASIYREMSFNDIHTDLARVGAPIDHNTELLMVNPTA